jgi:hypothetical protein
VENNYGSPELSAGAVFEWRPLAIIGVAPEGFTGTFVGYSFQFWVRRCGDVRFTVTNSRIAVRVGSGTHF